MPQVKEPFNLIICGVGGQGNIMASGLVGLAATAAGFKVVVGETYGASQRGGSVMSHLRFSHARDYGPLIPSGEADIIVAFEPLEALRVATRYANSETVVIVNTEPVYPLSVLLHESTFPEVERILAGLNSICGPVYYLQATDIARNLGEPRVQNIVMINALSRLEEMPFGRDYFESALEEFLEGAGQERKEMNRRAFEADCSIALFGEKE